MVGNVGPVHVFLGDGLVFGASAETLEPYIVDGFLVLVAALAPAVVGLHVVGLHGHLTGILHDFLEVIELRPLDLHVEIPCDDHRQAFRVDLVYPVHDQLEAVLAGLPASVVQVGVYVIILLAASLVLHEGPGGGADAVGIPALSWLVRSLRQPESAPFQEFGGLLVPEYGHVLSFMLAVVAPDSDALVSLAILLEILDLEIQSLLQAEDVRLLVLDHHCRGRITVFPGIGTVLCCTDPDVVGNHFDVRSLVFRGKGYW